MCALSRYVGRRTARLRQLTSVAHYVMAREYGVLSGSVFWLPECHFYTILCAMKTTIDSAGRIVVPKSLRQALNLKPGQSLEIRAGDGRLEIEIAATPMTLQKRGRDVVAIPNTELPTLTANEVRETLERIRR
jgi:AbrB family looped-hinge helix DNA binding protein